jgi:hypothetical protein
MLSKYKWTLMFSTFTPSLFVFSAIFAASCCSHHGTYSFAKISFPFGLLGTLYQKEITDFYMILGLLQFTIYGLIIDKSRNQPMAVLMIFILHFILVGVLFLYGKGD